MELLTGDFRPLSKRKITEETCRKFGYRVGEYKGQPVQIADYRDADTGQVCGQKVRFPDKDFLVTGKLQGLFGQHLFPNSGKMVVVVEGEIDCLTVSQLQGNKWPVVSIPSGAPAARKALAEELEWLLGFETVVLMFDNDSAGRDATEQCAPLFPPGRCKIAALPRKDANDMLVHGEGEEVVNAIWRAKPYRPDGIVTVADVRPKMSRPIAQGKPWWSAALTKLTYGRRYGELYCFGAGTGVGKTDFLTQQIAYDATELGEKTGVFFLEQQPEETLRRVAGKVSGKRFWIPDGSWTQEELDAALDRLDGLLFLFDHFGCADWDIIEQRIRFLHATEGVRNYYVDHLTALAAQQDDERTALEKIMARMGTLTKELDIVITLVSHLATPEGKPHEEGGRVMIRHFKGSRAIGFWCHFMFGLEGNTQDREEEPNTTFRVLKDRYTGTATGKTFYLAYDSATGFLSEADQLEECPF